MTIDEAIKHCKEEAEKYMEYGIETECYQCGKEHEQLAEWLTEYKEAKRLLKLAVEDIHELLCDRDDVSRGKGQACNICSYISSCNCCQQCTVNEELRNWRYTDEALKLIGGETDEHS